MKDKLISSVKWNIIGSILKIIFQLSSTVILTRLLLPEDFGLLSIALSIVVFGNMINNFGLGQALIQKKDILNDDIRYVFTLQMTFAIVITSIVLVLSPYLAIYFNNKEVENILNVMSIMFIIQAFGLTSVALLQRSLDFKIIQIIQSISYFISYAFIAIPLAYYGYGVWSLVVGQLSQSFLTASMSYYMQMHNILPLYRYENKKHFLNFGAKTIINNVVNWSMVNIDVFLIGHFLGIKFLGYYNRGNTLLQMPVGVVVGSIKGVLFSFYSKIQDNDIYAKKTFLGSVSSISFVIFPIMFTVALIPHTVVQAVFGNNWSFLNEIIMPLAIALCIRVLAGMGGPLVWGKNKGELEIIAQVYALISLGIITFFTAQISLVYVSWGIVASFIVRLYFVNNVVLKLLNIGWLEYIKVLYKPFILGALVSLLVKIFDFIFTKYIHNIFVILSFDVIVAALILVSLFFQFIKYFLQDDLLWLVEKNKNKLPSFIKKKIFSNSGGA